MLCYNRSVHLRQKDLAGQGTFGMERGGEVTLQIQEAGPVIR